MDDLSLQLDNDINRAEFIRDRLIPKAVLYYTGDILDDEDDNVRFPFDNSKNVQLRLCSHLILAWYHWH